MSETWRIVLMSIVGGLLGHSLGKLLDKVSWIDREMVQYILILALSIGIIVLAKTKGG